MNGQKFAEYYFRYDRIENEFKKAFQEYHDVYNKDIIERERKEKESLEDDYKGYPQDKEDL